MTFLSVAWQQIAVQQEMLRRLKTMNLQPAPSRLRRQGFPETLVLGLAPSVLALLVVSAILCGKNLSAQTHAPQGTKPAQEQNPAQPAHPASEAITAQPPALPAPIWLASQPNRARVSWDSHVLEIEAFNSSLNQILHQVAADTGAKLEGLTQDQHIFGSYGPGPWSDVLWKLLEGSGYNVLLVGGRDAPLEIVLSARSPASLQTAANNLNPSNSEDEDADPPPEPPRPPPMKTPFGNGDSGSPETPQQIMQDILERQQKIDQQQQKQQNNPQQ